MAGTTSGPFPVIWSDIVFWYDNPNFVPADIEEAWAKAHPDQFKLLLDACGRIKRSYDSGSDASAARAALMDANSKLIESGVMSAEFGLDTYKPGGQGHGGSARLLLTNGSILESKITIKGTSVTVRPMIHVRIGQPGATTDGAETAGGTGAA